MGKLHSKFSSKCRQSPEGGVLVSNLLNGQREVELIPSNKENLSMNMHKDVHSNNYLLNVTLPPEQGLGKSQYSNNEHTNLAERNTFTDDPKKEWLFMLCNESGNSNKEDMSNFLHGVCKAIDASVKPATDSTATLKIKIVLSSSDDQNNDLSPCEETRRPMRRLYCVGENIERRNHYLDLAGIENFTSKFDNKDCTHPKPPTHHHHLVATVENCMQISQSTHNSQKTRPVWKEEKSGRSHGLHPSSLCRHHSSSCKHNTNRPVHRSHSKRLRPQDHVSPRRPMCCYNQGGKDCDILTAPRFSSSSCSTLVRHHHLHEHHHHHHHHYHAA
ncbi:naked cuticle-like protein 3 [Boleophthalmus pectinirostris]|uniref:naked cuticle-like protein 3 n=1 Tax=Boleophthalmus pectinirostris TaxID=150288 RepID=UPI00242E8CD7|nr:naked cuticle-like protein 3 [Boleophthalmus pectinirostris]XP_055013628.1 naked cuticle-like protein 3 [Boleophthalmus pectinirostris]